MFWIGTLLLLVLGLLASADRLSAGRPGVRDFFAQVEPASGVIGVIGVGWGLWTIIHAILIIGQVSALHWLMYLFVGVLCVVLGFLLSFQLLNRHLLVRSDGAKRKGGELHTRLKPWRGSLGYSAIATALLSIVLRFV